jgi:hypothetical protein
VVASNRKWRCSSQLLRSLWTLKLSIECIIFRSDRKVFRYVISFKYQRLWTFFQQ